MDVVWARSHAALWRSWEEGGSASRVCVQPHQGRLVTYSKALDTACQRSQKTVLVYRKISACRDAASPAYPHYLRLYYHNSALASFAYENFCVTTPRYFFRLFCMCMAAGNLIAQSLMILVIERA